MGVYTFRYKQSSEVLGVPKGPAGCAQFGASRVASRTPAHLVAGRGGCHRSVPPGGAAYGMPRNSSTGPFATPRTVPLAVRTTSPPTTGRLRETAAFDPGTPAARTPRVIPRVNPTAPRRVRVRHPVRVPDMRNVNMRESLHGSHRPPPQGAGAVHVRVVLVLIGRPPALRRCRGQTVTTILPGCCCPCSR